MVSLKSFTRLSAPRSFSCCLWPQRCRWQPDSMMMFFPSRIFSEGLSTPWPGRRTGSKAGTPAGLVCCHTAANATQSHLKRRWWRFESVNTMRPVERQKKMESKTGHDVVGIESALKVFIGVQHVVWLLVFPSAIALAKWFVERLAHCVSLCGQDSCLMWPQGTAC